MKSRYSVVHIPMAVSKSERRTTKKLLTSSSVDRRYSRMAFNDDTVANGMEWFPTATFSTEGGDQMELSSTI